MNSHTQLTHEVIFTAGSSCIDPGIAQNFFCRGVAQSYICDVVPRSLETALTGNIGLIDLPIQLAG